MLIILSLFIISLCEALPTQPEYDVDDIEQVNRLFEDFIINYERHYEVGEKERRFNYFKDNLALINSMNQKSQHAVFDINIFSDWSAEEKKMIAGLRGSNSTFHGYSCTNVIEMKSHDAPDGNFDWNEKGVVTPAKDQGGCGSCWAFSTTGNVEGIYAMKYQQLVSLSEQQLVDCGGQGGCNGGNMAIALSNLIDEGGQESEATYPYKAVDGKCKFDQKSVVARLSACNAYLLPDEEQLKEALFKAGPLAIGIDASALHVYTTGILDTCACSTIDHGVLLVGYGTEDGVDFWNVKNSWGGQWGENGYFRVKRGVACVCIGEQVSGGVIA